MDIRHVDLIKCIPVGFRKINIDVRFNGNLNM